MSSALLATRDLHLQAGARTLVEGLTFEVTAGQCWALLGRNGSGKTTLLHALAGLLGTTGGEVRLEGRALGRLPRRQAARRIGLLAQDDNALFPASVLETVLTGLHPHLGLWGSPGDAGHVRARTLIEELGLGPMTNRLLHTLSGGERRRAAIAALLLQDPAIFLLDEPTNHLDLAHQQQLLALLEARRTSGRAVVMSLHDPNLAARHCTHALLLHGDGRHELGPAAEVLDVERLSRLYGHPLRAVPDPAGPLFVPT